MLFVVVFNQTATEREYLNLQKKKKNTLANQKKINILAHGGAFTYILQNIVEEAWRHQDHREGLKHF